MESFYGGKRGFSFILRPNPNDNDGYWRRLSDIAAAAANRQLKYGDYAVITESPANGDGYSEEHGKIYRIDQMNQPILVGRIGNPAPLLPLALVNNIGGENFADFPFLSKEQSKNRNVVKGYWGITTVNGENVIGLNFEFPSVEFDVTNSVSNNLDLQTGLAIGHYNTLINGAPHDTPTCFSVANVITPNTFIGTPYDQMQVTERFNQGDLWYRVYDFNDTAIDDSHKAFQLKSHYGEGYFADNYVTSLGRRIIKTGEYTSNGVTRNSYGISIAFSSNFQIEITDIIKQSDAMPSPIGVTLELKASESDNQYKNILEEWEMLLSLTNSSGEETAYTIKGELGAGKSKILKINAEDWHAVNKVILKKIIFKTKENVNSWSNFSKAFGITDAAPSSSSSLNISGNFINTYIGFVNIFQA